MIAIVCIDDNGGMMFNHRRQSMDRKVREDIIREVKHKTLYMNEYSEGQFKDEKALLDIRVKESADYSINPGDYYFFEYPDISKYTDIIEKIIVYHWNRVYPADKYIDINLKGTEMTIKEVEEFKGYSHDKITKEVYINEAYKD
ncbi:MAG: ribonuclease Z [Suipraeoptans sp.]